MDIASLKKTSRSSRFRNFLLVVQILMLLSAGTSRTEGQQPGLNRPSAADMARADIRRDMDQQLLLKPLPGKKNPDSVRLALKQINEDFRNIQTVNNAMMANAWVHEELDYGYISDSLSKIKSNATRLKSNLALPKAKDVEAKQLNLAGAGVKEFREALLLLDKSIMSFVNNLVLQKPNVVEADPASRVSHDLEVVIQLSENLQKTAEQRKKLTKPKN
ncbi:MAG: hypothetical protein ABI698_04380 [bacterium]